VATGRAPCSLSATSTVAFAPSGGPNCRSRADRTAGTAALTSIGCAQGGGPVPGQPAHPPPRHHPSFDQFTCGWANALDEKETELYDRFHVAGPGIALVQMGDANLNPWTEAKVNTENPDRGPLLIIEGEKDHTAPWAIAAYKRQRRNPSATPPRGRSCSVLPWGESGGLRPVAPGRQVRFGSKVPAQHALRAPPGIRTQNLRIKRALTTVGRVGATGPEQPRSRCSSGLLCLFRPSSPQFVG
jgi:hypothetical protein